MGMLFTVLYLEGAFDKLKPVFRAITILVGVMLAVVLGSVLFFNLSTVGFQPKLSTVFSAVLLAGVLLCLRK